MEKCSYNTIVYDMSTVTAGCVVPNVHAGLLVCLRVVCLADATSHWVMIMIISYDERDQPNSIILQILQFRMIIGSMSSGCPNNWVLIVFETQTPIQVGNILVRSRLNDHDHTSLYAPDKPKTMLPPWAAILRDCHICSIMHCFKRHFRSESLIWMKRQLFFRLLTVSCHAAWRGAIELNLISVVVKPTPYVALGNRAKAIAYPIA